MRLCVLPPLLHYNISTSICSANAQSRTPFPVLGTYVSSTTSLSSTTVPFQYYLEEK